MLTYWNVAITERRSTGERRAEIADAALRIIATRGIAALSTATLAAEVGLTTGALFRHFPSRDAILDEVSRRVEELLQASLPSADLPPAQRLERFLDARTSVATEHAGLLRLMQSEQFTLALPKPAAQRLRGAVATSRELVTETIAAGQATGDFRSDQPAQALAIIVLGTLQMLAFSANLGLAGENELTRVRATLRDLLVPTSGARGTARTRMAAPKAGPRASARAPSRGAAHTKRKT